MAVPRPPLTERLGAFLADLAPTSGEVEGRSRSQFHLFLAVEPLLLGVLPHDCGIIRVTCPAQAERSDMVAARAVAVTLFFTLCIAGGPEWPLFVGRSWCPAGSGTEVPLRTCGLTSRPEAPRSAGSGRAGGAAPSLRGRAGAGVHAGSPGCLVPITQMVCSGSASPSPSACTGPDAARKRAHLLRWGPASSPPFVSFTLTPVAHRYKSNEEYVYVRGRGRGKYVCEECGIRCKKPSMLKKHIRTHTDVRPYVCKHCHFAFKTKGKRQSAGPLALPPQAAPLWEPQHRAQGPRPLCLGLGHPHFLGSPMAEQLAPDRPPACPLGPHTPRTWHSPPPGGPLAPSWFGFALITHPFLCMSPKPFVHPPDKLQHPHLSRPRLHLEIHSTPSH